MTVPLEMCARPCPEPHQQPSAALSSRADEIFRRGAAELCSGLREEDLGLVSHGMRSLKPAPTAK